MTLQGFYTDAGRALAAQAAVGATQLTITRVMAGSGHTADIPSAAALPNPQQELAMGTPIVQDDAAYLPATLTEVQTQCSYSLTELGVYAQGDDGEVLFQVFQLDNSAHITAGGESTLRFYLRQSIGENGLVVSPTPAGVVTVTDLKNTVFASAVPSRTVSVSGENLPELLAGLPRFLTEKLTVEVSGTCSRPVIIKNFCGSGSLTLTGMSGAVISGVISIDTCSIPIRLRFFNCTDQGNAAAQSATSGAMLYVRDSNFVSLNGCTFTSNGTAKGALITNGGILSVYNSRFVRCHIAVCAWSAAKAELSVVSGENNDIGIHVYMGGIVLLTYTSVLVGGVTNTKDGGMIFSDNQIQ